jgi:hypothetical protein
MTECDVTPWEHLLAPGTGHGESGRRVSIDRRPGEQIRMFLADTPEFRKHFGNQQSCDVIFLVESGEKRKLFFVELKGRNFEECVPQLADALLTVRKQLPPDCRSSTEVEVVALGGGGTPRQNQLKALETFQRRTGKRLIERRLQRNQTFDLRRLL